MIPFAYFIPKTYYKLEVKYIFFFEMRFRWKSDASSFVYKYFFIEKTVDELKELQDDGALLEDDSLVYPLNIGSRGLECGRQLTIEKLKEEWFLESV